MQSTPLTFTNAQGQTRAARLDLPVDGAPLAYVLFAHLFGRDAGAVETISLALTGEGLAVLCFDIAELEEDGGAGTPALAGVDDLVAAARALALEHEAPQVLIGHSLAGTAALLAASELSSLRAVVTLAAPWGPEGVGKLLRDGGEGRFTVQEAFLDALERLPEATGGLRRALLVLHSPTDARVGVANAAEIFMAAKHPKSFISLDNADHHLTRAGDARYAGAVIAAWTRKYLTVQDTPAWWEDASDNRVMVRTETGFRTEMRANGFHLVADEPASVGGTEAGPTPYDYLGAALGACTSMTLRMYADRKGWDLAAVTVGVRHSKAHAQDCETCEKGAKLDRFERLIRLEGALDDAQRQRLLEIAERCPVHRTLEAKVMISSRLDEGVTDPVNP